MVRGGGDARGKAGLDLVESVLLLVLWVLPVREGVPDTVRRRHKPCRHELDSAAGPCAGPGAGVEAHAVANREQDEESEQEATLAVGIRLGYYCAANTHMVTYMRRMRRTKASSQAPLGRPVETHTHVVRSKTRGMI